MKKLHKVMWTSLTFPFETKEGKVFENAGIFQNFSFQQGYSFQILFCAVLGHIKKQQQHWIRTLRLI